MSQLEFDLIKAKMEREAKVVRLREMKDWHPDFKDSNTGYYVCPHCDATMIKHTRYRYCPFCGYKIEWSE